MATCPTCGETVRAKAKRCPSCTIELRDEFGESLFDDDDDDDVDSGERTSGRRHTFMEVVGESHYQVALQALADLFTTIGRTDRSFSACLRPEPTNPHDPNAIAVTTDDQTVIGYLSRPVAKQFGPTLRAQPTPVVVQAQLRGGSTQQPSIGVVLDFSPVYELVAQGRPQMAPRPIAQSAASPPAADKPQAGGRGLRTLLYIAIGLFVVLWLLGR